MKQWRLRVAAAILSIPMLVMATGCSPSSSTPAASDAGAGGELQLKVGVVPGIDVGLLDIAIEKGYFKDAGLALEVTDVQGPQVVTGVVSGQFDLAYAAYAPPLLALASGTKLEVVSGLATIGAEGHNGGTLVRSDSGINRWSDLAGRKIAATSPRSLTALTLQAAINKDGGDPSNPVKIVPLPQSQVARAVSEGTVDAAAVAAPFDAQGIEQFPNLKIFGDSTAFILPEGAAYTGFFTTDKVQGSLGEAMKAFQAGMVKAVEYGNANPKEVRLRGAARAGLDEKQALSLPDSHFSVDVDAASLQILVDAMVEQKWITKTPDLSSFVTG